VPAKPTAYGRATVTGSAVDLSVKLPGLLWEEAATKRRNAIIIYPEQALRAHVSDEEYNHYAAGILSWR
jgi:hypothetical protein